MGIYQDLQDDLLEAFQTDLIDAYIDITVTVLGEPVYNPIVGSPVTPETDYTVKCIKLEDTLGEIPDQSETTDRSEYIILDVDKITSTIPEFKIGQKVTDNLEQFKITGIEQDPVKATHTITCRRWA